MFGAFDNIFHVYLMHSLSRHEKHCQMLHTLFGVFQYSRNTGWVTTNEIFLQQPVFSVHKSLIVGALQCFQYSNYMHEEKKKLPYIHPMIMEEIRLSFQKMHLLEKAVSAVHFIYCIYLTVIYLFWNPIQKMTRFRHSKQNTPRHKVAKVDSYLKQGFV